MLQKFLLIGVGGSGGKTLRYTWRELDRRLLARGWTEGVPGAWRFLHIDVPQHPDVIEGDIPVRMGNSASYLGLAQAPRQYWQYDDDLARRPELLESIAGWRPDPRLDYTSPYKGAGQRRVVGRIITLSQLDDVGRAIDSAVASLSDIAFDEQLSRLGRHLGTSEHDINPDPATAVVISSLGGGAGSGAVLDIIELVRARATEQAQWLDNTLLTVLFAADVFSGLAPEKRAGVEPNSLATISELLAAFEHQGPMSELEGRLLDFGGGTAQLRERRCGLYNFMIGSKNASVDFKDSLDVFRAVGKALATLVVDDTVRHQFQSYLGATWAGAPVSREFRIVDQASVSHPCSSFGYASVSLGRSLFAQYAAERLAKKALERLLRGHREELGAGVLRLDEALVAEKADAVKESFFDEAGLWELSVDHNQVLDAFRDITTKKKALDDVLAKVRAWLSGQRNRKLSPREWLSSFGDRFDSEAKAYEDRERAERIQRANAWVSPIQERVLATTAAYAGNYGLPVTVALLELLERQIRDAADQLERDKEKFEKEEDSLLRRAEQFFLTVRERLMTESHSAIAGAGSERREALQRRTEAELYGFTCLVLRDLNTGFLPQLRAALSRAQATLARAELGEFLQLVSQWSARAVPTHLMAPKNEILLEKEAAFPDQLDQILQAGLGAEGAKDAESAAVVEIISGAWPSIFDEASGRREQQFIAQPRKWQPSITEARAIGIPTRKALFEVDVTPETLLDSAGRWVRERQGATSQHVGEGLAQWLDPEHDDSADRADRFVDAMDRALRAAAPLVSVNPEAHRAVHGNDPPAPAYVISEIPLDSAHRARKRVRDALASAHVEERLIERLFNPTSKKSEVEITSFMGWSVHPVVFDSLMGPVQEDWQRRTDPSNRRKFWQFRRSRPLTSFIPMSPGNQRATVRGWITAGVLGQVPVLEGPWSTSPLRIWTPRGWKAFPKYLLGEEVSDHGSALPALLESLPLALLTFASGQREELEAYLRLLDLGTGGNGPDSVYATANPELVAWVTNGELATPDFEPPPVPPAELAGDASSTAAERATLIADGIRAFEESYRTTVGEQRITPESSLTVGRAWEIRNLVSRAAIELAEAVERLNSGPMTPPRSRGFLVPPAR